MLFIFTVCICSPLCTDAYLLPHTTPILVFLGPVYSSKQRKIIRRSMLILDNSCLERGNNCMNLSLVRRLAVSIHLIYTGRLPSYDLYGVWAVDPED